MMFDNNIVGQGPRYVEVTENRASTDESVRLLKELEREAEKKIIEAVRVENSIIDCVVHSHNDMFSGDSNFTAIASINGKKIVARFTHQEIFSMNLLDRKDKIFTGIRDALAKEIANKLLFDSLPNLFKKGG